MFRDYNHYNADTNMVVKTRYILTLVNVQSETGPKLLKEVFFSR